MMKKTIFVVDDMVVNLAVAKKALKELYRTITFSAAEKMFAFIENNIPDLILLDIEMPEMDGFEALAKLKENAKYAGIPVIFLTSIIDPEIEARGFEVGAIDFINKPFSECVLLNRVKTHMDVDQVIKERTVKLQNLQNALVHVMADMVENRDKATGGHIERTTQYLEILLTSMREQDIYMDELEGMDFDILISSARLHDVGKISVSDLILNKPEKLSDAEYETMKCHAVNGSKILEQVVSRTDEAEFLTHARIFALTHHERWDGKGYPKGLSGMDIPIQGRIMAIVDVFDALVSERPYKPAFSVEKAEGIILEGAGTQFDPLLTMVFSENVEKFREVVEKCSGGESTQHSYDNPDF